MRAGEITGMVLRGAVRAVLCVVGVLAAFAVLVLYMGCCVIEGVFHGA